MAFYSFILATILPAVAVMIHCIVNIMKGRALETYDLVIMDHPVLTSLNVSYLEVFIGDVITILAVLAALGARHYYYRDERDFMRKYKIKGKTGFTKDFTHGKHSQDSGDFSDGD